MQFFPALLIALSLVFVISRGGLPARAVADFSVFEADALTPSWLEEGVQQGGEYGYAVSGAGDVDGDGYADLLVGAPKYEKDVYREGVALLFRGGPGGLAANPSLDGRRRAVRRAFWGIRRRRRRCE